MARKPKQAVKAPLDRVQAKARKQKRLAIILCSVLALVLVYEVPHTLKLMKKSPTAVVVSGSTATPAPNPTTTTTSIPPAAEASSAPSPTPTATTSLVASVQAVAGPGQLTQFERFASKDPFDQSVVKTAPTAPSSSSKTPSTSPSVPKAPPAPPPTAAVISLNGELMSVASGTDFPTSGTTFDEAGGVPLFHLLSLTQKSAKVTIAGGSYADGAPALTLTVGKAVTLQNTADGKQYTLILEPQGTQVPTDTTTTSTTSSAPAATTSSVVPSSGG